MRPHRLSLEAFGAFPERVDLDLDALGEQGLVLFSGATGSGKTTLLDAIGFALYGKVPGEREGAKDLRSHHAAEGVAPWVELEFSARGRRFLVRRSPAWSRPGRATPVQGAARLSELRPDGWAVLSQRADEVGHELGAVLGMNATQFHQVVVLPQGRFADFLQADTKDREALLRKLFAVERFEQVQAWLGDRAGSAEAAARETELRLGELVARVEQADGSDRPEETSADVWATALLAQAAHAADARARTLAAAERARRGAEQALAESRELAGRQQRRLAAESERDALRALEPEVSALRTRADLGRRAAPVLGSLRRRDRAAAEAGAALAALEAAAPAALLAEAGWPAPAAGVARTGRHAGPGHAAAPAGSGRAAAPAGSAEVTAPVGSGRAAAPVGSGRAAAPAGSGRAAAPAGATSATSGARGDAGAIEALPAETVVAGLVGALREALSGAQERLADLRALEPVQAEGVAAQREVEAFEAELAEVRGQATAVEAELADAFPVAVAHAEQHVAEARAAEAQLPELREEAAAARRAEDVRNEHTSAERVVATATSELAEATAAAERLELAEQELRRKRVDAVATELATYLVDGTPCPVCGSLAHPDPAEIRDDDVSRAEERAATAAVTAARQRVGQRSAELDAAQTRLAAATAVLTEVVPARVALAAELASVTATAALLADRVADLEALRARQTQAAITRERLTAAADAAIAAAERAGRRIAAARSTLEEALGERPLASVLADARHDAKTLDRALAAGVDAAERLRGLGRAAEDLAEILQSQGFSGEPAAREAAMTEAELDGAARRVTAWDEAMAGVQARLSDPDLAVAVSPPADTDAAAEAFEAAWKAADEAREEQVLARDRAAALSALVPSLVAAVEVLAPLRATADELRALADVANGKGANRLQMTLATFVLAARLEEVAEAASRRLLHMTAGRYSLVHSETNRDRRSRAGLALQVDDAWTGRRRDTATLSGGETFQAALSLALGLTDVVTAEAGGATIDALFVDEGFGSLDPDSLDGVMDVLDALRSGGRLVGVVSHVAEMKQRITAQVLVDKGTSGSTVRVTAHA